MTKEACGIHYKYTYLLSFCYLFSESALIHENNDDIHPRDCKKVNVSLYNFPY